MVKLKMYTRPKERIKTAVLTSPEHFAPEDSLRLAVSSRASTNETELLSLSTQPSAFVNSPYDPRLYKTVDPTCITTTTTTATTTCNTIIENTHKISLANPTNTRLYDNNFLVDELISRTSQHDFYTSELVSNPNFYQDYLCENQPLEFDNSNISFGSTSYELDSNMSISSNENINPAFFHHTPSPNNTNSIRIITGSNRITKLKDRKLVQAIHRSLDIKKEDDFDFCFKTLNENHSTSLNRNNIMSSPRKEINDSLTNAIFQNDLPQKRLFNSPFVPLENYVFSSITKQLASEEISDCESIHLNTTSNNVYFPKTFADTINNISDTANTIYFPKTFIDIGEYEKNLEQLESEIAQVTAAAAAAETTIELIEDIEPITTKNINVKTKRKRNPSRVTTNNNTDESYEEIDVKKVEKPKRGRKPKNSVKTRGKSKLDAPEPDIVMKLFRESMRKNKDNFSKNKSSENGTLPKMAKLKVQRNVSNIKREPKKPAIVNTSPTVDPDLDETLNFEEKDIFKCAECPKIFRQRSQWKRHVDCIHLKIAKFICIKCTKAFKRSDHLKNHIRRIHGVAD